MLRGAAPSPACERAGAEAHPASKRANPRPAKICLVLPSTRLRGGGCGASKPMAGGHEQAAGQTSLGRPAPPQEHAQRASLVEHGTPHFELSTPMLTMPFPILKDQGRICKSTKEWRTEALEKGWLVVHAKVEGGTGKVVNGVLDGTLVITSEGKVVIFLSHTCTRAARTPPTAACAHGSALTPSSSACPHRVGPRLCRQDQ